MTTKSDPIENIQDKKILLDMLKENGLLLAHAHPSLKNDPDVVLVAVENKSNAIQYASQELLDNKEFMLKVLASTTGWCVQYASDRLKADIDIAKCALNNEGRLNNLSPSLYGNKEVVLIALESESRIPLVLKHMEHDLFYDMDVILKAFTSYPEGLNSKLEVIKEIRKNSEFIQEAVKLNYMVLCYADDSLKNDKEIIYIALLNDSFSVSFIGNSLRKECGNDPLAYLEAWFRKEKLNEELPVNDHTSSHHKKIKI